MLLCRIIGATGGSKLLTTFGENHMFLPCSRCNVAGQPINDIDNDFVVAKKRKYQTEKVRNLSAIHEAV